MPIADRRDGQLLLVIFVNGLLVAFAIALSEISFLGFGNTFWSLVIGTAVSLLLERDALRALQEVGDEEAGEESSEKEEIERMLEQAQGRVEGLDEEPEALRDLEAQLREIRELWHPHIGIEEKHLDAERLGEMLPVEEHERISGEMGKLSMEHAEPLHLVVPFALYNLPADERAALTRNMPPKVIEELMPGPWKERWAPMQPFLLA